MGEELLGIEHQQPFLYTLVYIPGRVLSKPNKNTEQGDNFLTPFPSRYLLILLKVKFLSESFLGPAISASTLKTWANDNSYLD